MQRIGVLFVCLGNICRSPSAQAVLEDRLERRGLAAHFRVDSCGTAAFNVGKAPDPRAIAAAERRGYRIAHQRARQVEDADFARFQHIVAMDRANLRTLQGWAGPDFAGEIHLLLHFAPGATTEVADPYYGSPEAFDAALDAIERGVDGLLLALCARHGTELAAAAPRTARVIGAVAFAIILPPLRRAAHETGRLVSPMTDRTLEDLNVETIEELITPDQLKAEMPLTPAISEAVRSARGIVRDILDRQDHRLFLVVGPCSIHDTGAAMEYAHRLSRLAEEVQDTLYLVMRVYFEKPRTTTGWKGLVNDPHLNDSFRIEEGLHIARKLLIDITGIGLPTATEALDPISPQYLQDLIAWSAIGARTTESQTHRELASGLSCAVGFKNGTDGGLTVAVNALKSVNSPHRFLGINIEGKVAVIHTRGNRHAHVVLRGGTNGPNYDSVHVAVCERELEKAGIAPNIVVDCSHANSNKDHALQALVLDNVANQILEGNRSIVGAMLESNLEAGNQPIPADLAKLRYGVSVTDACMDWDSTEQAIRSMHEKLRRILPQRCGAIGS